MIARKMEIICRQHAIKLTVEALNGQLLSGGDLGSDCDVLKAVMELVPHEGYTPYPCGLADDKHNIIFKFSERLT